VTLRAKFLIQNDSVVYWRNRAWQYAAIGATQGGVMSLGLIFLAVIGWMLGLLFMLILMRMAGDQDRAARREEKRLDPFSDVTITNLRTG